MFNFDEVIDREGTSCVKYDKREMAFGTKDILPMWVADMDFKSPPCIIDAVRKSCDHGVFGYTFKPENSDTAFINWVRQRYNWEVKREWISSSPGVVSAIPLTIRCLTNAGDKVLIQTPVYPPFHSSVKGCGRELVRSPLKEENGHYSVDWDDFENKLKSGVKMFILCNSHNPVGRVWSMDELQRMGELCYKYSVVIFSDEIHADLALFGNRHTVMASISEEISSITVTAMAPSKTFNIAGLLNSVIVISSPEILSCYNREISTLHLDLGNLFSHVAMEAAYIYGAEWLEDLKKYLEKNVDFCHDFITQNIPAVKMVKPEGSFLLWLDFRKSGYSHNEVKDRLINISKLGLNDGLSFGSNGKGFFRMNIGAPISVVREGLERLKRAF
ncbi:MAG: PatB family C-S lyase [Bacteroidales bacterium]|nr:PatB family C-S lyase [Bacteroidales bacterium]